MNGSRYQRYQIILKNHKIYINVMRTPQFWMV